MAPCTVKKGVQLIPKERTRIKSGLQRFALHLRNMRLIGGDTVITAALLPLLGFLLLHGLKDVPWLTIVGLLLVGLLLTSTKLNTSATTYGNMLYSSLVYRDSKDRDRTEIERRCSYEGTAEQTES